MKNLFVILSLVIMFGLGWFANEALQTQRIYAAAKPVEYKFVIPHLDSRSNINAAYEKTANTYAQQGWRLHGAFGEALVFER